MQRTIFRMFRAVDPTVATLHVKGLNNVEFILQNERVMNWEVRRWGWGTEVILRFPTSVPSGTVDAVDPKIVDEIVRDLKEVSYPASEANLRASKSLYAITLAKRVLNRLEEKIRANDENSQNK